MSYEPTTFFIIENQELDSWWVGQGLIHFNDDGVPSNRTLTRNKFESTLTNMFQEYSQPYLNLEIYNKRETVCYGVERWLSKLKYEIKRKYDRYFDIENLLSSGWMDGDDRIHSTLIIINVWNERRNINTKDVYADLKKNWGTPESSKPRSVHTLSTCLNCVGRTAKQRYAAGKNNPDFVYKNNRSTVLHMMDKQNRIPRSSTLEKYDLKK